MMRNEVRQIFTVYRWNNPQTASDYPFLAVAAMADGRRMLLSLGNHGVAFDWNIPDEAAELLATDFAPTGATLQVNLAEVQAAFDETFVHGTESGSLHFDAQLSPCRLQLVLGPVDPAAPDVFIADDRGAEYVIEGFGSYLRFERTRDRCVPVTFIERAMLDTCISTFAELAGQWAALVTAPPPPRYLRGAESTPPAGSRGLSNP